VKVICQFRGRENEFRDLGRDMFVRFVEDVGEDLGTMEGNPSMEGNRMVMSIAPVKEKSANNVSTRQERNKRKQAKKDAAAAAEGAAEEDEDGSYDEDDEEGSFDEEYEEEAEEVTVTSN
jgi:translation initiation factor IF-3